MLEKKSNKQKCKRSNNSPTVDILLKKKDFDTISCRS